jgi:hypothetical protein
MAHRTAPKARHFLLTVCVSAYGKEVDLLVSGTTHPAEPQTWTDPGCPGEIDLDGVWHTQTPRDAAHDVLADLTDAEREAVEAEVAEALRDDEPAEVEED